MTILQSILRMIGFLLTVPPLVFLATRHVLALMEADAARQQNARYRKQAGRQFY